MVFVNQGRQVNTAGVEYFSAFPQGIINGFYMGGTNHNDEHCGGCGSGISYGYCDIKSVPFSSGNASVVGYLDTARTSGVGVSSTTHGYYVAGHNYGSGAANNTIKRFLFTSPAGQVSDVGTLVYALHYCTSGNASGTHGYACNDGNILRFPFANSSASGTDVGNLTTSRGSGTGSNSDDYGYQAGGDSSLVIDRYAYANEATASGVGNLARTMNGTAGGSSATNGYAFGRGDILRYSHTSSSSGNDVGNLPTNTGEQGNGISSSTHSYTVGGSVHVTRIDKFSHANESSQALVGHIGGSSRSCSSSSDNYSSNWNRYAGATVQY